MYFAILLKLTNTFIHWFCSYLPSVVSEGEHAGTNQPPLSTRVIFCKLPDTHGVWDVPIRFCLNNKIRRTQMVAVDFDLIPLSVYFRPAFVQLFWLHGPCMFARSLSPYMLTNFLGVLLCSNAENNTAMQNHDISLHSSAHEFMQRCYDSKLQRG